jgi:hypothetical protein
VAAVKYQQQCADGNLCRGQTLDPWLLQFDHVKGKKRFNISEGIGRYGDETLRKEIAKTEIVCALDHAERTYQRRQADARRN